MKLTYIKSISLVLLFGISLASNAQIITTFAGNGVGGFSGDGGPASSAEVLLPYGIVVDASGNIYITDSFNNRIRIVNTSGIISTIAGNGYGAPTTGGFSGDGGPATAAELYFPNGLIVDTSGNVYISDYDNNRVRMVNTSGIISTIAGNGTGSYSGDGGPATAAELYGPTGIAMDASGNIYIADYYNSRIRIINTSAVISAFAGNGVLAYSGDGGPATSAELYKPSGVTPDGTGNIYIADYDNSRVRIVNTSGIISTFAGDSAVGFSGDGGPATAAELDRPANVILDAVGNVYIADYNNNRIRIVNTSGTITTIAGNGFGGFSGDGGLATAAELNSPTGLAMDAEGNIYIADWLNTRIRKISSKSSGINQLKVENGELKIYPNPNSGSFTVSGISQGQIIEIYNYIGQKTLSAISYQPSANFDISNYANGIYLIRILNKDGSVFGTEKVVKTE